MALTHIIAHHIQRQTPDAASVLKLRDACWEKNERIEECFRELKVSVLKRIAKDYGRFSDDHTSHPLSTWLSEYCNEKMDFESLTEKAMQQLKTELDKTEALMDGYLLFAHEVLENEEFIHVFFVQHNKGQFIDGNIDINESFYLDTSDVGLAAKINLTDWLSGDVNRASNALMLLRWRGAKSLTDVFSNFIGFAEKVDVIADTEAFLEIVSDYTKDLPEDLAFQTKKQVVDYCFEQDKVDKPVVISELSKQLKSEPSSTESIDDGLETRSASLPEFAAFVSEKNLDKLELIPDKSRLRQFVRISGRDNNLSMSFASSCLGDTIVYDPSNDSLTITNIPQALKARLAKHLKG
ncbi:MAG: nucleoid-associated protein [Gammaproteobacteria bacterium]|jgi:nucleoid-associated protein